MMRLATPTGGTIHPKEEAMAGGSLAIWVLAISGISIAAAPAAELDPVAMKLCVFDAAAKLPQIEGLEIKASHAVPASLHDKSNPEATYIDVDLEVHAAGQDATFSFLCGYSYGKPVAVLRGVQ
jgi:hypothetical protein